MMGSGFSTFGGGGSAGLNSGGASAGRSGAASSELGSLQNQINKAIQFSFSTFA